jgi:subtilase family serine protease
MKYQRLLGTVSLFALVAASSCSHAGSGSMMPPALPSAGEADTIETPAQGYYPMTSATSARRVCSAPATADRMRCFAWMRTDLVARTIVEDGIPEGVGFTPSDIASAYKLNITKGGGQTVAIVDAFGYTQAESDLAAYRKAGALPECSTANGCLRIVNQTGSAAGLPPPNTTDDWRGEQALDLDAVSAACPKCKIVLVQTSTDSPDNLAAGVVTAVSKMRANIVSNSYGGPETPALSSAYNQPGHVIVAAAGDNGGGLSDGGGPSVPCTLTTVVCVGGTHLVKAPGKSRGWRESVWNDLASNQCNGNCGGTGSACSNAFAKPAWQSASTCPRRAAADVSAVASVFTPFAVYSVLFKTSQNPSPWAGYGGTSLATPLIAGMFALAGNAATRHGAEEIWKTHSSFFDVTTGTNVLAGITGPCASTVPEICTAKAGYDGPTGWGSPNGTTDL